MPMGLSFLLDDGGMARDRSPFREGTKAILPYKIGHMALLDNPLVPVSLQFYQCWSGAKWASAVGMECSLKVFLQPEEEQILRLGDIIEQFKAVVG